MGWGSGQGGSASPRLGKCTKIPLYLKGGVDPFAGKNSYGCGDVFFVFGVCFFLLLFLFSIV